MERRVSRRRVCLTPQTTERRRAGGRFVGRLSQYSVHTVCGPGRVWALALPDRLGDSLAGHAGWSEKNLPFLNALRASTILVLEYGRWRGAV